MKKALALFLSALMLLAFMTPFASAAPEPPQQLGRVRNIRTPVAGQYPMSFYRNQLLDYNYGHAASGMTQSISWAPDIDDRGFLPNTVYTCVLELEPVSGTAWTNAGFSNPASFSANEYTWQNLRNLPPMEDITEIRSEYFTGAASGNYFATAERGGGPNPARNTASSPTGANMRVFITFKPTESEPCAPAVIFFDDFNGPTKTGTGSGTGVGTGEGYVAGMTTFWARGSQQTRQSGSYWLNDLAYIEPDQDNPDDNVLVLGWRKNTGRTASGSSTRAVRPAVPPTAYGAARNGENYDTLEILFNTAIFDAAWMGGDYIVDILGMTHAAWAALPAADKLAAWNGLAAADKLTIWNGFWPAAWTNLQAYSRDAFMDAGCVDTRIGGVAGPFSWAYGYYEVGLRMTSVNGIWTAFWLNGEGTGGSSGGGSDSTVTDINRIESANPVLARPGSPYYDPTYYGKVLNTSGNLTGANLTAAQMLSAAQRQASWHSAEVDCIEDCEQVMESGYSTGLHYGGYSGYGTNQQHQEAWMPYDVSDYGIAQAARLNIFDGEIHKLGYEWSPTDVKFFLDDELCAQGTDDSTHYTLFDASKDQVPRLPSLDGRLGVPQNPNMMRLSIEGANWSGHGIEYKDYPYLCGLGIMTPTNHRYFDESDPYKRFTEGTQANGAAAVITYVCVINGPKPGTAVYPIALAAVNASKDEVVIEKPIDFTISVEEMIDVNLISLDFTFDASYFDIKGTGALTALNGFSILSASIESTYGSSIYKGSVVLMSGAAFISSKDALDILNISGVAKEKLGDTALTLDSITLVGKKMSGKSGEWECEIVKGAADVSVIYWTQVFSPYDLNKGPVSAGGTMSIVDAVDLSIAVYFYQMRSTDADWNTPGFNGVTADEADVNNSGVVNLADLIEIMANYGPYSVFPG